MAKVGLLVIATNKYIRFIQPLLDSMRRWFLPGHEVTMFVFTDAESTPAGTVRLHQAHMPWPNPTLLRYHVFTDNAAALREMDYLFYSDADMRFENHVGDEVLGDLVVVRHPGFWDKPYPVVYDSYEHRPESNAFVPRGKGGTYFAGGFNGGKRDKFMAMAIQIRAWVDDDLRRGIVAKWHDESYLNKYMTSQSPTVLDPSYCYQEELRLPFPRKLVALYKNHGELRA